eukprot:1570478-Rhodomonas_salina.1
MFATVEPCNGWEPVGLTTVGGGWAQGLRLVGLYVQGTDPSGPSSSCAFLVGCVGMCWVVEKSDGGVAESVESGLLRWSLKVLTSRITLRTCCTRPGTDVARCTRRLHQEMTRNRFRNYVIVTHGLTMRCLSMVSLADFAQISDFGAFPRRFRAADSVACRFGSKGGKKGGSQGDCHSRAQHVISVVRSRTEGQ